MLRKRWRYLPIILILLLSQFINAFPDISIEVAGGINLGGISEAGYTGDNYSRGYNFAVQPFVPLNNIFVGTQISYSRFFPAVKISDIEYASLIKFAPSIRYIIPSVPNPKIFYQLGIGYYWLYEKWDNSGYVDLPNDPPNSHTINDFGVNLGLGFLISDRFVVCPSCDIVFHEKKSAKYFKVDLGIIL